jgi:hypothetical protein
VWSIAAEPDENAAIEPEVELARTQTTGKGANAAVISASG